MKKIQNVIHMYFTVVVVDVVVDVVEFVVAIGVDVELFLRFVSSFLECQFDTSVGAAAAAAPVCFHEPMCFAGCLVV